MNYTQIMNNLSNTNSFQDVLSLANTTTGDIFWNAIYWMVTIIILVITMNFGFEIGMLLAFFGSMIMGLFLMYLGLISSATFGITEAVLFFITIYLVYTSSKAQ